MQGGIERSQFGETAEALFLTSGFVYDSAEQAEATFNGSIDHYQYSRFGNPTVAMLERRLALLEGAEACRATATGMAAVNAALLAHLKAGDRVVASRALFGACHWIVSTLLPRYGIASEFVDGADLDAVARGAGAAGRAGAAGNAVQPDAGDRRSARGGRRWRTPPARSWWWTTCSPPRCCRSRCSSAPTWWCIPAPSTSTARAACWAAPCWARKKWIEETLQPFVRNTGPALSPFNAWLLLKGLETLALRVEAACRSAAAIADFLAGQPGVARVWYPTRADHPQRALAMAQVSAGGTHGDVRGRRRQGRRRSRVLNALRLVRVSNNLGDSKSLITHPATTTHMRIGAEERARLGITDGVVRLSVGLEDVEDLKDDLGAGAGRTRPAARRA